MAPNLSPAYFLGSATVGCRLSLGSETLNTWVCYGIFCAFRVSRALPVTCVCTVRGCSHCWDGMLLWWSVVGCETRAGGKECVLVSHCCFVDTVVLLPATSGCCSLAVYHSLTSTAAYQASCTHKRSCVCIYCSFLSGTEY